MMPNRQAMTPLDEVDYLPRLDRERQRIDHNGPGRREDGARRYLRVELAGEDVDIFSNQFTEHRVVGRWP